MNGNYFSEVYPYVTSTLNKYAGQNKEVSNLSAYVVAANYTSPGLVIETNPNRSLIGGVYGTTTANGVVGRQADSQALVQPKTGNDSGQGLRPSPIITQLEVSEQNSDDGASNFSRTAKFTIRCFSMGQMEVVVGHFLNPGSSIFLQYGWNKPGTSVNTNSGNVAKYKDFGNIRDFREKCDGTSDVYLGFVVGGDVSMQNDYWDITVNCKGHMELPAWMMAADNTKSAGAISTPEPLDYAGSEISDTTAPLGLRRWKTVYNVLPSSKKTAMVKGLEKKLADIGYYINFDEQVKDSINNSTKSSFLPSIFGGTATFGAVEAELSADIQLVGNERYIMFGPLMDIINCGEYDGVDIQGGSKVDYKIHSEDTFCCAFKDIYSHDKTKLFIPNQFTPIADFETIAAQGGVQTNFGNYIDNRVKLNSGKVVRFPEQYSTSVGGHIDEVQAINPDGFTFGKLDYLYVNFDFAKKILETKNLTMKDAVYQILNGMSAAAGGIWDFQIVEVSVKGVDRLEIIDFNLTGKYQKAAKTFEISGLNSPFLEAGLKIDISGQMSNQIVLEKAAASGNSSMPPIKGLFIKNGGKDMILGQATKNPSPPGSKSPNTTTPTDDERKKRDFALFLEKVCLVPKTELEGPQTWPTDGAYWKILYQAAFDEMNLHESLKQQRDVDKQTSGDLSILLPVDVTLTSHGVSGFKRGDMLRVRALPEIYNESGFFQVTGVQQNLQDDYWTTTVTATFRTKHSK